MKRVIFICAMAIGFLTVGCSSENKQEQMADSSMGADTGMMMDKDTSNMGDTSSMSRPTTGTGSSDSVTIDRSSTINSDSVRQ